MKISQELSSYFKGNGFQVSTNTSFPQIKNITTPLDNSFRLCHLSEQESDFIYTENILDTTKYNRILYQEILIALKKESYFIVNCTHYKNSQIEKIKEEALLISKGKFSLKKEISEKNCKYLVFQKTKNYLKEDDDINSWSFGIITNGTRDDFIEKFIQSIKKQSILNYEILICGKLQDPLLVNKYKNTRFIFFDQKSDKGWITRKKNIICENARYENIVLVHDRFYLDDNWFKGMKKYGNYFEVLSCEQIFGKYKMGWGVYFGTDKLEEDPWARIKVVDDIHHSDWSPRLVTHNGVSIMKKSVWEMQKWNENLFWNEKDDTELSFEEYRKGIMIRFNPYSIMQISHSRVGLHNLRIKKNTKKDGWFRWDGKFTEKLFYRLYMIKQSFLVIIYLLFRINLFDRNLKEKIKEKSNLFERKK